MELLIAIAITVMIFILALYRTGYKNGYIDGFKFGKEDAEKEYRLLIDDYEEKTKRYDYYR